jgi:hypothetical protein
MANASVCIHANTITLKAVQREKHVWIEVVDEEGVLSNVAIFVDRSLWDKVEKACERFNLEMAK